jgi:hypothetical protein
MTKQTDAAREAANVEARRAVAEAEADGEYQPCLMTGPICPCASPCAWIANPAGRVMGLPAGFSL